MQERYANIEKENRRLLTRMQEPVGGGSMREAYACILGEVVADSARPHWLDSWQGS